MPEPGDQLPAVSDLAMPEDRPVLERLWQLYKHDMSEFVNSMPDRDGRFKSARLDNCLAVPNCAVYLTRQGEIPVGFVTVRGVIEDPKSIGDFFVIRRIRRSGIGYGVALHVLRAFPGRWEIAYQEKNSAAARFWRKIATTVAGDRWREERRPVPGKPGVPPDIWITFRLQTCQGHYTNGLREANRGI